MDAGQRRGSAWRGARRTDVTIVSRTDVTGANVEDADAHADADPVTAQRQMVKANRARFTQGVIDYRTRQAEAQQRLKDDAVSDAEPDAAAAQAVMIKRNAHLSEKADE